MDIFKGILPSMGGRSKSSSWFGGGGGRGVSDYGQEMYDKATGRTMYDKATGRGVMVRQRASKTAAIYCVLNLT